MCSPSLMSTRATDAQGKKQRFWGVVANSIMAGRGDPAAKQRLQLFKNSVQQGPQQIPQTTGG